MKPVLAMCQKGKSTVKIASAHADPIILIIKRDHGRENNVQRSGADSFAAVRLEKSEFVSPELGFGRDLPKLHLRIFFNDWRKNVLFHRPCARNYFPCVHFVRGGDIASKVLRSLKPGRRGDFFANQL